MELISVTKRSKDLSAIKKLYKHAFPKAERVPFRLLVSRAAPDKADFWALHDDGKLIGMAYAIKAQGLAYLYFFAIDKALRGKGYGSHALETLKSRYADGRFFLALETLDESAQNYDYRVRRHEFYKRCGFIDLPHKIKEATVVFASMGVGGEIQPHEYRDMMSNYLGERYMKKIDPKMF